MQSIDEPALALVLFALRRSQLQARRAPKPECRNRIQVGFEIFDDLTVDGADGICHHFLFMFRS